MKNTMSYGSSDWMPCAPESKERHLHSYTHQQPVSFLSSPNDVPRPIGTRLAACVLLRGG